MRITKRTNIAIRVLMYCTAHRGRLVTKSALLDHAYGVGADVDDRVVEVYVSRLRAKLKPFGIVIRSQRGLGYQLLTEATT